MRLATFLTPEGPAPHHGEVRGDRIIAFDTGSVIDRLASGDLTPADGQDYALDEVSLLAPVQRPRAIFGIGLNYAAHAAETGKDLPEQPMVFMKLPRSSVSPNGTVHVPAAAAKRLDYEVELVVVLGADNRIAGYAVANDLSARDLQGRETQWTRAKGFDSSCPWGPWITTADEVADPEALRLSSQVNGEVRQDSTHRRPRLRPAGAGRLDRPDVHARTRRHHPHRHAGGRRPVDGPAAVPRAGRRRAARGREPRRDRAHDRDRWLRAPETSTALGRDGGTGVSGPSCLNTHRTP